MVTKEAKKLVSKSKCIFCGANLSIELYNVFDTRFGIKDKYKIGRCTICETEQILPLPSIKQLKELYETYYNFGGEKDTAYTGFREYFFSSVLYRFWLAIDGDVCFHSRRGNCRLLDIGCNEGQGLQIYKQNGFMAEGLEINDRAAAEARNDGFSGLQIPNLRILEFD